jgi:hypothetical protein
MATEIVLFMDNLRGKEYARKIEDYIKTQHNFDSKDKV